MGLLSATVAVAAGLVAAVVPVDDFAGGLPPAWSSTVRGAEALTIVPADGGRALRARWAFTSADGGDRIFITRAFKPPLPRRAVTGVRFRYLWDGAAPPLSAERGFVVRLRTSPTAFADYPVPVPAGGWPVGRWVEVTLATNVFDGRLRNVYRHLAETELIELTFRLGAQPGQTAQGHLHLADITLDVNDQAVDRPYAPQPSARPPHAGLRVLDLSHGGDGFYRIAAAARRLDPRAEVIGSPFRGLHFPLWRFPRTRAELLGYDVVFVGDVDPWVFTAEQVQWLADAVHSGVGLLVGSGPNSFGGAERHPPAWLALLPVAYTVGAKPVAGGAVPAAAAAHELTAGLDAARLGRVGQVADLRAGEGGQTLLTVGARPLLVAGQRGAGRVVVLNTWAQPAPLDDGAFLNGPLWEPFAARLLAWLAQRPLPALRAPVPAPAEWSADAQWLYGKQCFAPGSPFGVVVQPKAPAGANARPARVMAVMRAEGAEVWRAEQPLADSVTLPGTLPELAAGPVEVTVQLDGRTAAVLSGQIVDRLRRRDFYPLITMLPTGGGGHLLRPEDVEAWVDEVGAHGFNTVAVGGLGANTTGAPGTVLRGRAEARAAAAGLASILEYTNFGTHPGERPFAVSPFDPAAAAARAKKLAAGLEQARYVPRLLSVKYRDEPTAHPAHLADATTRAALSRLLGPLPAETPTAQSPVADRYRFGRALGEVVAEDIRQAKAHKDASGAPWDLVVTFMHTSYGGCRPPASLDDAWRWAAPADRFDFDVYPYFYPTSQRLRFVQADWGLAASRVISRAASKPWGFYVELDDRNWPYQQNPAEASAECAFTAVAAGADYLNSFILTAFGTGTGGRPERWAKTGEAMRAIRRLGPLLCRSRRVAARVGVLWPETQALVNRGYEPPIYTRALLAQALGDCDVVHEDLLTKGALEPLDALVITGVQHLRRDVFERLLAWVAAGGFLAVDPLPVADEQGRELVWPAEFSENRNLPQYGQGRLWRCGIDLEERLRHDVEADDGDWSDSIGKLHGQFSPLLRPARGVTARVTANAAQSSVGIRTAGRGAMVVVVNHAAEPREVVVETSNWPFRPVWVTDLLTNEALPGPAADGTLVLRRTLPARSGWFVGVYAGRPTAAKLEVQTPRVKRGERLRYRVALTDGAGQLVPAAFLVDLTVTGPNGRAQARLGGARATDDGRCEVDEVMPLNVPLGRWQIEASAPQAGLSARSTFDVGAAER